MSCIDGLVLRGNKIIIPDSLQSEVIGLAHECHLGADKTVKLLRETTWFPKMSKCVNEYVSSCRSCLAANNTTPPVPLQPNMLPERAWQKLHADFKGPIGEKYYLHVLIDQYSKFPEVAVVTSTKFEKLCPAIERAFATRGIQYIPEQLSCHGGPPYKSHDMEMFAKEMGFELMYTCNSQRPPM